MDFLTLWAAGEPSAFAHLTSTAVRFLIVLFGINALIIVHEFGHFIVARMCGVRCEKFYIWFDAWGFKFFRFKRGDTEYGLGWLPLGGYVKMLGQEDNPAAIKEEIERAKQDVAESGAESADKLEALENLQTQIYAPDSYLSKNVFQRMAIISAGVIMNVIFAVICAAAAFMIGFPEMTSRVGTVMPGSPAWTAALRAGDTVVEMDGKPVTLFAQIPYGLINGGDVSVKITRDGAAEPIAVTMAPKREKDGLMPVIGVLQSTSLELAKIPRPYTASLDDQINARSAEMFGALKGGDRLISMNGEKVESPGDYERLARKYLDREIEFVFAPTDRKGNILADKPTSSVKTAPLAALECGVRLTMGEIVAIQNGSPAEKAGLKKRVTNENGVVVEPGDVILAVDGKTLLDPLAFPTEMFRRAASGSGIILTVRRGADVVDVPVTLSTDAGYTGILSHNGMMASDAIGVAYAVEPVVSSLDTTVAVIGSDKPLGAKIEKISVKIPPPAADAAEEIQTLYAQIVSTGKKVDDRIEYDASNDPALVLDWFTQGTTRLPPGTEVAFTVKTKDGGTATLQTALKVSNEIYRIDRGLIFGVETRTSKAASLSEAVCYGWDKTVESMGLVFRVLKNIGRNVSAKAFGGPGMIVGAAWTASGTGDGLFLIFLCVIGANLAVINILPIPVLDGGHLVFLLYEAIFRKPANETVQVVLSFIGLFLLLSLMAWVILLDIARYAGWM